MNIRRAVIDDLSTEPRFQFARFVILAMAVPMMALAGFVIFELLKLTH